jgi:hypothetical protein
MISNRINFMTIRHPGWTTYEGIRLRLDYSCLLVMQYTAPACVMVVPYVAAETRFALEKEVVATCGRMDSRCRVWWAPDRLVWLDSGCWGGLLRPLKSCPAPRALGST